MKIKVFGSGCSNCKKLYETTKKIIKELDIKTGVEYIEDVSEMIKMGIMSSPALVIDDKIILAGGNKSEKDIKEALIKNLNKKEKDNDCCDCCSCGCGKC